MNCIFRCLIRAPFLLGIVALSTPFSSNATSTAIRPFVRDCPALRLESLIFKNTETWTFWLNGIRMDAGSYDKNYLSAKGLRLLEVREDCILLCDLKNHETIFALKPKATSQTNAQQTESKKKAGQRKTKTQKTPKEDSLGF